ncbi:alpha/beta fold hydrolase [bacterium]|jgi:lysophospholipase|nr:alpha/beta fold hydrolase [bacterium]MBT4495471.1 alpha/beta fold hydrolase [bacterium]MBT4764270.1 alpha/beta fold hydrolase [bacterium]MBT5401640.1 alpha/beta fold hydrolase [bacterium]MBT5942399.1 alpha/beta fold hydrolase [bacterium]
MKLEKVIIKNRKGQGIVVLLEIAPDQKGLAFVMHGLGGYKEQPHVEVFAKAFLDNNYSVIRFDTTNTFGESDGNYEDATISNYYEDLEDVIEWAKNQEWYQEPFCLAGHSLGGICISLYAQKYPENVKALAPISSVVSGKLSLETKDKEHFDEWKKTGYRIKESSSKPGLMKKLKWSHISDRLKYDLIPETHKLTMPVLLIVGTKDASTPLKHQQILFKAIPGDNKEIHLIEGAPHTFKEVEHLKEIREIFDNWIKSFS